VGDDVGVGEDVGDGVDLGVGVGVGVRVGDGVADGVGVGEGVGSCAASFLPGNISTDKTRTTCTAQMKPLEKRYEWLD
jgi:hypothetical protein